MVVVLKHLLFSPFPSCSERTFVLLNVMEGEENLCSFTWSKYTSPLKAVALIMLSMGISFFQNGVQIRPWFLLHLARKVFLLNLDDMLAWHND